MSLIQKLRTSVANFIAPVSNAMNLALDYKKYGSKAMESDWTQIIMKDSDIYTGYAYAAIRRRANAVARVSKGFVRTKSEEKDLVHPYVDVISSSKTFTDYQFWYEMSTFLDLRGVYYLMAIRAVDESREKPVGNVKEFKLLNPYNIKRVISKDSLEVVGYIENRGGFQREIPKDLIIEIRELNPFDDNNPFSITDAAKESQFTLKTAGDYTRHSLKHNINAPGILSTDVILEEENFKNFTERVKGHQKGEPIFANGEGAIKWDSMNVELSKAALKDINEIQRQALFAVMGESKTTMGIEESGVTRETSRTQKDLNTENQIIPRIQLILDAMNQDYKNNYEKDYEQTKATLVIENPLETDHEADKKANEVKVAEFDLYTRLLNLGYSEEVAAAYVEGEIDIEEVGSPTVEIAPPVEPKQKDEEANNQFEEEQSGIVLQQQSALQNAITKVEQDLVISAVNRIPKVVKNQLREDEIITETEKKRSLNDLIAVITSFYGIVYTLKGTETMRKRLSQFSLLGQFSVNREVSSFIKEIAKKSATTHVNTVTDDILKVARDGALKGLSVPQIQGMLKESFSAQISETRAKAISRSETNRAFTMAQFEADKQFIAQNKLEGQAFKQWITRSDDPCPFCLSLEAEGKIPFDQNFRSLGDEVVVGSGDTRQVLPVTFADLQAGNAHTNCSCAYQLIIENANNSVQTKKHIDLIEKELQLLDNLKRERKELKIDEEEMDEQFAKLEDIIEKL